MILRETCSICGKKVEIVGEQYIDYSKRWLFNLSCGHVKLAVKSAAETAKESFDSLDGSKSAWEFQKEGVRFCRETDYNCLIADAMGLGKTIQALLSIRENFEALTPVLLVVPSNTIYQWVSEFQKWTDGEAVVFHITDSKSIVPVGFKIYICSRDLLAKKDAITKLIPLGIKTLIVDEIHGFKDRTAKRTEGLFEIVSQSNIRHKILLSGTPIKNRANEYFTALNLLAPGRFPVYARFVREWLEPNERGIPTRIKGYRLDEFHALTSKWIIRREKKDVLADLPKLQRNFVYRDLKDPHLKNAYNAELDLFDNFLNNGKGVSTVSILGYLARLRHLVEVAKVPLVVEYAKEFLECTEDKLAIGLHHKAVKATLVSALAEFKPVSITGDESPEQKFEAVKTLRECPENRLALINILAGGQGTDGLQDSIANAISIARQWNFSDERQFEDRFHRFGQTKPVVIDYLLAAGTIDQYFTEMVERKRKIFRETVGEDDYVFTDDENSLKDLAQAVVMNRLK